MLQIYKARIVNKPDAGDDRLQVRIIPHMMTIAETDLLPKYPPFFRGEVITGVSERQVDNQDVEEGVRPDYVWVASLPDFTVGYVLGLANHWRGEDQFQDSYNYEGILQAATRAGIIPNDMKYKDMYVQHWNDNYLEMVNRRFGEKFIITSSGAMLAITRNQVYMQVGNRDPEDPDQPFSFIRMGREEIGIQTKKLRIRAENIVVGERDLALLATSTSSPFAVGGATLHPLMNFKS